MSLSQYVENLGHIAIYTQDLENHIAFYEKLGAVNIRKVYMPAPDGGTRILCLLDLGNITLELSPGVPPGEGTIPHFAVKVTDLDAAAAAVKAAGIDTFETPEKKVNPGFLDGMECWFFRGPSGERIELLADL